MQDSAFLTHKLLESYRFNTGIDTASILRKIPKFSVDSGLLK